MEDTIFDKIIRREIPAEIVYEDEKTIAFLDAFPNHPGHTLVVPKDPSRNLLDIPEVQWLETMKIVHRLTPAIKKAVGADGININVNNELSAGQKVFHTHVHIIPRYENDGFKNFMPGTYANDTQKAELGEKIRNEIA